MAAAVPRTPEHRRTWPERFAIGASIAAAVICFATAGGLVAGYVVLQQREVVDITNPAQAPIAEAAAAPTEQSTTPADGSVVEPTGRQRRPTTPPTFPPADPDGEELPRHRGRQRRVHRPQLAVRRRLRRPRGHGRAQRHDHHLPRRSVRLACRGALVPARPVRHDRRRRATRLGSTRRTSATTRSG